MHRSLEGVVRRDARTVLFIQVAREEEKASSLPPNPSCPALNCSLHGCLPCPLCPFCKLGCGLDPEAVAHSGPGIHHCGPWRHALEAEGPGGLTQK